MPTGDPHQQDEEVAGEQQGDVFREEICIGPPNDERSYEGEHAHVHRQQGRGGEHGEQHEDRTSSGDTGGPLIQ
jgi:hypothetical protein